MPGTTLAAARPGIMERHSPAADEIPLRQHLALLHCRLVEGIDAEKVRGDDRLQHEMHEKLAEACLVQPIEVDGAHRPAVLRQGLSRRAALRRNQVADGPIPEIRLARESR